MTYAMNELGSTHMLCDIILIITLQGRYFKLYIYFTYFLLSLLE